MHLPKPLFILVGLFAVTLSALTAMGASSQSIFAPEVERWRSLTEQVFPADEVNDVLAVIQCESFGDPTSRNMEEWGQESVGLLQINEGWLTGWQDPDWAFPGHDGQPVDLEDPATNLRAAKFIRYFEVVTEQDAWAEWACKPY